MKEDAPEVTPVENFIFEELSEIVHITESTKYKMLLADPDLERSVTSCQGLEKVLTLYHTLYKKDKTTALFKLLLMSF